MMETYKSEICCACLSNRKIVVLDDEWKRRCFLRTICEIPAISSAAPVIKLCKECDALLTRFTEFKQQAQRSYSNLQNFTLKDLKPKTDLQIHKQFNINISPNDIEIDIVCSELVKIEKDDISNLHIKQEYNDISERHHEESANVEYSDDDNKALIEISSKKKKINSKKKVKKKEKFNFETKAEPQYYKEIELNVQEVAEERIRLELQEEYVNAVFRCQSCILSFPNGDDLKDHVRLKHDLNSPSWKCEWCECTFGSQVAYNYHSTKHTRRYECLACNNKFNSKRGAIKHYEMTHTVRQDLELSYDSALNNTAEDQTLVIGTKIDDSAKEDTQQFPCEMCDKSFKFRTSLRKHVEKHRIETGQKRRPYCEICRLTFSGTSNLQKHVKSSSKHQIQLKLRKLKEDAKIPNSTVDSNPDIERIRCMVNSGRQLFNCGQCERKFQWRGNLLRHEQTHKDRANGELVCAPCNRSFSSIATYKQHMKLSRKHVSENDFKYMCSDCGKRFANKTRLKDHVDWEHLKNYVHKCSDCGKVFKSHTSLYLHKQVVHKKDNVSHLCDHCGKPFANRAKLRSHIVAIHSSDAPYACCTCNARFSWHSCLSRHVRRVHKRADKAA